MRPFSKEATGYAVLLVLLFTIAAIAVWQTLSYLSDRIHGKEFAIVASLICAITFGFMLIAGAFGLWAIKFVGEAEGRRRLGQLVEAMGYMRDGLLTLDRKGRITGSNPTVKSLATGDVSRQSSMQVAFPSLTEADVNSLVSSDEPFEVEHTNRHGEEKQTLRFRSQPSQGLVLVLVSDVTLMEAKQLRARQAARLQLIGEIARGVANDFNSILCAISGHASLLSRLPADSPEGAQSIQSILIGAERGTTLAAHLLDLSAPSSDGMAPMMKLEYVVSAVDNLRSTLPANWDFVIDVDVMPHVGLTGIKIEQVVTNLGLLAADGVSGPGVLRIKGGRPDPQNPLMDVSPDYEGVLIIAATNPEGAILSTSSNGSAGSSGVILSVLRGMIEQAQGTLEVLTSLDGAPVYRVVLPRETAFESAVTEECFGPDLGPYIANWSVLLAFNSNDDPEVKKRLLDLKVHVEEATSFISVLAHIENGHAPDAIVVDKRLITVEAKGLLKAMVKLCPTAAVVVLCDNPREDSEQLESHIVFLPSSASSDKILFAMVEARSLALKRTQA